VELRDALVESEIPLAFSESSENLPGIVAWLKVSWAQTLLTLAGLFILSVIGNTERRGALLSTYRLQPRTDVDDLQNNNLWETMEDM
jgi:hypothetical protein